MAAASEARRIVFLCSGGGGNLAFVHEAIQRGWLPGAQLAGVLTDRNCGANAFADRAGLFNRTVHFQTAEQDEVLEGLRALQPDLIITTVNRILRPPVVSAFRGRLLNLHYSLLPAFGGSIGVKPVQAAVAYGARFAGVTVHEVDESLDGGKPVVQAAIPLQSGEANFDELMNLVFRCGCLALLAAMEQALPREPPPPAAVIIMMGRTCLFNGGFRPRSSFEDEAFWREIARAAKGD
ncbi:MAG: Phosphoribosylglycinamide formyltransferase [Myxococcota bacterium]|nr:Phosphoribosylglycinamide formyltransferase [Myxococcota bacterium]